MELKTILNSYELTENEINELKELMKNNYVVGFQLQDEHLQFLENHKEEFGYEFDLEIEHPYLQMIELGNFFVTLL